MDKHKRYDTSKRGRRVRTRWRKRNRKRHAEYVRAWRAKQDSRAAGS